MRRDHSTRPWLAMFVGLGLLAGWSANAAPPAPGPDAGRRLEAAPPNDPQHREQAFASERCRAPENRCTWELTDGGPFEEKALGAAALTDGGFIVVGNARSGASPFFTAWAMRVSADGRRQWRHVLGGAQGDQLYAVAATPDGGALAVGHTRSKGAGESDFWVVRLAPSGLVRWERTFGGPANDRARAVARLPDGDFVLAGFTASFGAGDRDLWVIRIGADGGMRWARTLGGAGNDAAFGVAATTDGGVVVTGQHWRDRVGDTPPGADLLTVRLDADGVPIWRRIFDRSQIDIGTAIAPMSDGGFVVLGSSQAAQGLTDDIVALRLAADGAVQWERRIGAEKHDMPWSAAETADGDVLIAAATWSYGAGSADAWLLRLDPGGVERWRRTFGGPAWDRALGVLALPGDEMLVIGHTSNKGQGYEDAWLLRLDGAGRL